MLSPRLLCTRRPVNACLPRLPYCFRWQFLRPANACAIVRIFTYERTTFSVVETRVKLASRNTMEM